MLRALQLAAAGAAVAFTVPLAAPASAQHVDHTTPGKLVTLAEWTKRMNRLLVEEMRYPAPMLGQEPGRGVVRVKFNCSDSGRPDKVALLHSSGQPALDREALRAVKRLASLHPLPTGFTPDQKFEAVLVFALDPADANVRTTAQEQARRNAWYRDPDVAKLKAAPDPIAPGTQLAARQ